MFFVKNHKKMITKYCVKVIEECHGVTLHNQARRTGNVLKSIFIDKAIHYTWNPGSVIVCFRKNLQEDIKFIEESELKEGYAENRVVIVGFLKSILDSLPSSMSGAASAFERCIISDALYWSQPQPGYPTCGQQKYIQRFNEYLERTKSLIL